MAVALHYVHISDTHLGAERDWTPLDNAPYRNLERVVEAINSLSPQPRFVMHTGDVANHDTENAYIFAAELLGRLQMPVYFAAGNHDVRTHMLKHLQMGDKRNLLPTEFIICYRFSVDGERFLVLDSQQPYEKAGHFGKLGDAQLSLVRDEAARDDGPLTVFLHHAPVDLDSAWFSEQVGMLDGDELHQALLPARDKLRGVFFGHVHRDTQTFRDGILYASVASTFCQLNLWPTDTEVSFDTAQPPAFNFVTCHPDRMIVKSHTVTRD